MQRVASHVLDWRGQFVTMTDRSYLARLMPVLVVWGSNDMVISAMHAQSAPSQLQDVHVLDGAGHFPHKHFLAEFSRLVVEFVAANAPACHHRGKWRALLRRGDQYELTSMPPVVAAVDEAIEPIVG